MKRPNASSRTSARQALSVGIASALLACSSLACGPGARSAASEPPRSLDPESMRSTAEGPVIGLAAEHGSHAWLGIPFAEPPTGPLRWQAPRPPRSRSEPLEATRPGPACPQLASALAGVPGPAGSVVGSEDCLYLNVWAPRLAADDLPVDGERWPVMVWVHGGANSIGTGASFVGARLAREHGVLLVTVNYRLGPLGWFRHPALRTAQTSEADDSGNYGTLDLIRALEWVKQNAASFGGDPERVTLFGESAGGVNVFSLLASPLAEGLFQRAIVQSGLPSSEPVELAENLEDQAVAGSPVSGREIALRLLVARGRASDRTRALALESSMAPDELARFLRNVSPAELIAAYEPAEGAVFLELPVVLRDGHVLPERELSELFTAPDGIPSIPVMLGTNRDEIRAFQLATGIGVRNLLGMFPRAEDPDRYVRSAYFGSAIWKAMGADEIAAQWVRAGHDDVWVYRFDWDEEPQSFVADMQLLLGAGHGVEVPFVFGDFRYGDISSLLFTEENEPGRRLLSDAMMAYWAEFAAAGDPGRGRANALTHWRRWSEAGARAPRFMILDTPRDGGLRMSYEPTTRSSIARELSEDAIFAEQSERCELMEVAAQTNGIHWEPEHLELVGCAPQAPVSSRGG